MYPLSYHHDGFLVTNAILHQGRLSSAQVNEYPQSYCGDNVGGYIVFMFFYVMWAQSAHQVITVWIKSEEEFNLLEQNIRQKDMTE